MSRDAMWDGNAHLTDDEKALIKAVKETGDPDEVRRLLAAGVGVDIRDGHNMPWDQTPLMLAAHNGFLEIVRILLAAGASVSAVDKNAGESEGGQQPLHHAVKGRDGAIVESILDAGADVNALTSSGNTPLNLAIRSGDIELMRLLVRRGAAVTKFSRKRLRPPLIVVAASEIPPADKPAVIDFLLQAGADANATGDRGNTPLKMMAAGGDVDDEGRLACLAALLKAGAKDLPDIDGGTALHIAIYYKNAQAAMLLVESGSDINHVGKRGTALDIADQLTAAALRDLNDDTTPERLLERTRRALRGLEDLVRLLQSRGGKRAAEMSVSEIAAATGAAVPTESTKAPGARSGSPAPKPPKPPLGVRHFLKLANDGEPEWALFAVQAPREQVTDLLSERHKAAKVLREVELKGTRKNDELARRLAIVQIRDNPWTVVLRSLYYADAECVDAVAADAHALSRQLGTKAICFVAEDTSGAVQYDFFENGELIERAQWTDGGSFTIFELTRRKRPELEEVGDRFADKTFRDLGIYLPACYPRANKRTACLCVGKPSAERVEGADLMELE